MKATFMPTVGEQRSSPRELAIALLAVPVVATLLLGVGGIEMYVVAAVVLQLAVAIAFGRSVWPHAPRASRALRACAAVLAFWVCVALLVPRAHDRLGPGLFILLGIAGALIYLVLAPRALRREDRVLWAWPLVIVAAFVPIGIAALVASAPKQARAAVYSAFDLRGPRVGRIDGAGGQRLGASLAVLPAAGGADVLVGAPDPGTTPGIVYLVRPAAAAATGSIRRMRAPHVLRIIGTPGDSAGFSLAVVPNGSGPGKPAVLIGAPTATQANGVATGAVYVLTDPAAITQGAVRLGAIGRPHGPRGYEIIGPPASHFGYTVANAGDVNGDGIDDFAIGAPLLSPTDDPSGSGIVYVVYGQRHPHSFDVTRLGDPGTRDLGYRIVSDGIGTAGLALANVGDVNSDGRPDLAIGLPDVSAQQRVNSGGVTVVYGQTRDQTLNLATVGAAGNRQGFRIYGGVTDGRAGTSVAAAGDVNGDGLDDVLLGVPRLSDAGRPRAGGAYVVFGSRTPRTVDLQKIGKPSNAQGFEIEGAQGTSCLGVPCGDEAGTAVAGIGDVNGDGRPDLLIGAPSATPSGRDLGGAAFVVYGPAKPHTIDLARIGTHGDTEGFRIDGQHVEDELGTTIAGGSLGHGTREVLVGAPDSRLESGTVYELPVKAPTQAR
jgi:hypothetical protein